MVRLKKFISGAVFGFILVWLVLFVGFLFFQALNCLMSFSKVHHLQGWMVCTFVFSVVYSIIFGILEMHK